jgi:hypothetical protein
VDIVNLGRKRLTFTVNLKKASRTVVIKLVIGISFSNKSGDDDSSTFLRLLRVSGVHSIQIVTVAGSLLGS